MIPSLRPLSTLRPWRSRTGSRRSLTTACPSAASVGARMAASSAASTSVRSRKTRQPGGARRGYVSGSPTPSSRTGQPGVRSAACAGRSGSASVNRTSTSVASTRIETTSPSRPRSNSRRLPPSDEQARRREDHRGGDRRQCATPSRDHREAEDRDRDDQQLDHCVIVARPSPGQGVAGCSRGPVRTRFAVSVPTTRGVRHAARARPGLHRRRDRRERAPTSRPAGRRTSTAP